MIRKMIVKRNPLAAVLILLLLLSTACHFHRHRIRTVSINTDQTSLKIEYSGKVYFNDEKTAIDYISPGGYVKYKKDDNLFFAKSNDESEITYKLINGDIKMNYNDEGAKFFIARAVKEIAQHCESDVFNSTN